jgi:hypothetical protein
MTSIFTIASLIFGLCISNLPVVLVKTEHSTVL